MSSSHVQINEAEELLSQVLAQQELFDGSLASLKTMLNDTTHKLAQVKALTINSTYQNQDRSSLRCFDTTDELSNLIRNSATRTMTFHNTESDKTNSSAFESFVKIVK